MRIKRELLVIRLCGSAIVRGYFDMALNMDNPIIEVNTHGMNVEDALKAVEKAVKSAGKGVYKINVIHGFN